MMATSHNSPNRFKSSNFEERGKRVRRRAVEKRRRRAARVLALTGMLSLPGPSQNCVGILSSGSYERTDGYDCFWGQVDIYCDGSFVCGYHQTFCVSGSSGTWFIYNSC